MKIWGALLLEVILFIYVIYILIYQNIVTAVLILFLFPLSLVMLHSSAKKGGQQNILFGILSVPTTGALGLCLQTGLSTFGSFVSIFISFLLGILLFFLLYSTLPKNGR